VGALAAAGEREQTARGAPTAGDRHRPALQFACASAQGICHRRAGVRGGAALLKLGSAAKKLQIIAVSVDPKGDTPATVKAFLAEHEMTGRMEYLIGSFKELAPVWRAYGVEVQASPDKREDTVGHSAFVYGITGSGSALVIYPPTFEPRWIVHDVPLLASY